jgi:hypothetical protein
MLVTLSRVYPTYWHARSYFRFPLSRRPHAPHVSYVKRRDDGLLEGEKVL